MPALLIAAAAALASWGTAAALTGAVIGTVTISATAASLIGAVVGLVVAVAGSMLLSAQTPKPQLPDYSQDRKQAIRSGIEPFRIVYGRTLVSGPVVYMGSSGTDNEYLHIVVVVAGHEVDGFEAVHINDKVITLADPGVGGLDALDRAGGAYAGTVRIHTYDGTQSSASAALISECAADWTSDHKLLGLAYIYVRVQYARDQIEGFDSIAAVVRGKPVYDPRTNSTAWSANFALAILDYLTSADGLGADRDTEIDAAYFEAAANVCDEDVDLDLTGTITEKRYELHGSFKLDQAPADILESMLSAGGGAITYVAGAYRLQVAAYESPAITLTTADMAGNIRILPKPSRRELINRIQATYIAEAEKWTAVSAPPVIVTDFETEDGEVIVKDVEFPFVTSRTQVQRLARIALLRARRAITVELPLKVTGLQVTAWSTIGITFADLEWTNKAFQVVSWRFDPVSSVITITAREELSTNYTWEHYLAGPDLSESVPTLVNPLDITAPTGLTITATTALQGDGGTVPALLVEWSAPPNPYATSTEVQWKKHSDSAWSAIEVPAPATQVVLSPLLSDVDYDVRVRSRAGVVPSAWSATSTETVAPDTTAPSVPGSVAATGISTGISLSWTKPTQPDFVAVEVWENTANDTGTRYYVGHSGGGGFLRSGLGGGQLRYYWVRSYDRSGNYSAFSSVVSATSSTVVSGDINGGAVTTLSEDKHTDEIAFGDGTLETVMTLTVVVPDSATRVRFTYMLDFYQGSLPGDSGSDYGSGTGDGETGGSEGGGGE